MATIMDDVDDFILSTKNSNSLVVSIKDNNGDSRGKYHFGVLTPSSITLIDNFCNANRLVLFIIKEEGVVSISSEFRDDWKELLKKTTMFLTSIGFRYF
jgi:hypothetical protein